MNFKPLENVGNMPNHITNLGLKLSKITDAEKSIKMGTKIAQNTETCDKKMTKILAIVVKIL